FSLQRLELIGNDYLTRDDVLMYAGIDLGMNVLQMDVQEIREKLAELPVIADVSVARRLPSSLVVRVVERIPVAYIVDDSGFWKVDSEGTVLYFVDALTKSLPLLTSSKPFDVEE